MSVIQELEKSYMRENLPDFRAGDTVAVHYKIKEGDRERIQIFEGVVIAMKGGGARETFIVRKVSYGVGVERIFALHSPLIDKIEVKRLGKVRRAKLYYLRGLSKKASRIKERSRLDYQNAELKAKEAAAKAAAAAEAQKTKAAEQEAQESQIEESQVEETVEQTTQEPEAQDTKDTPEEAKAEQTEEAPPAEEATAETAEETAPKEAAEEAEAAEETPQEQSEAPEETASDDGEKEKG